MAKRIKPKAKKSSRRYVMMMFDDGPIRPRYPFERDYMDGEVIEVEVLWKKYVYVFTHKDEQNVYHFKVREDQRA